MQCTAWGLKWAPDDLQGVSWWITSQVGAAQWFLRSRYLHTVLSRHLWWEMRGAATDRYVPISTISFEHLGDFRCEEMSYLQLYSDLCHQCCWSICVLSTIAEWLWAWAWSQMCMNPRPGRWGLTVWCGSKGGADPQRKVEGSRRGRIAVVESKVDQLSHILVL